MPRSWTAFVVVLALCLSAIATPLAAPAPPRRTPKLVVLLVVDQMRADYVERFGDHWTGGLRRLMDEGAWLREAAYSHMATVTCVGHASIVTGALPRTHGIVGNDLWDREAGKAGNCVADPATTLVGYGTPPKGTATSTRNLRVPTLADEMRAQLGGPTRIVSLSLKDYTATTMAGRRADTVVWMSVSNKSLMTSSAYTAVPVRGWPGSSRPTRSSPTSASAGRSSCRNRPTSMRTMRKGS